MHLDPSLEKALSLADSFLESYVGALHGSSNSKHTVEVAPSAALSKQNTVQDHSAMITPPPELRLRNALPEPQADCQQADQSASQAIQQASQQASQSIQQASQQASQAAQQASQQVSQAAQQASQSAAQAISQLSNQLSQSIAAASRSVSSAISSASSAIASAQSSADQAVAQASSSMLSAQASASSAQLAASQAVVQAGAAVAAATGSAAAAGSSFLSAASKATQSAQFSVSAISAAAAAKVSQESQQVTTSQTTAITATQTALAIVGSIIASALITIIIYFLITRYKRRAKRRPRKQRSLTGINYFADPKFPPSDQNGTTIAASQSNYPQTRDGPTSGSPLSLSGFQNGAGEKSSELRKSVVKTTTVPWNPSKPPKPPTLNSWLKVQEVSPFGPIKLPTDTKDRSPLGGQLKSPLRNIDAPKGPRMTSSIPVPTRSPKFPSFMGNRSTVTAVPRSPLTLFPSPKQPDALPQPSTPGAEYRESKASVWTDDVPYQSPSPLLQSPPRRKILRVPTPAPRNKDYGMTIPSPPAPVRTTAEWLASRKAQDSSYPTSMSIANIGVGIKNARSSFDLPRGPKSIAGFGVPRLNQRSVRSIEGDLQGLNRFLAPGDRASQLSISRAGSYRSVASQQTPGVGKAL